MKITFSQKEQSCLDKEIMETVRDFVHDSEVVYEAVEAALKKKEKHVTKVIESALNENLDAQIAAAIKDRLMRFLR